MEFRGTTICAVKRGGMTAIAGDGQVTMGESVIMKGNAVKVKRIYNDKVVIGFAGSVSDAFALSEKFEEMLQKYSGNLMRSAVELAELWRSDKMYRKLEALLIVADANSLYIVSGSGICHPARPYGHHARPVQCGLCFHGAAPRKAGADDHLRGRLPMRLYHLRR